MVEAELFQLGLIQAAGGMCKALQEVPPDLANVHFGEQYTPGFQSAMVFVDDGFELLSGSRQSVLPPDAVCSCCLLHGSIAVLITGVTDIANTRDHQGTIHVKEDAADRWQCL